MPTTSCVIHGRYAKNNTLNRASRAVLIRCAYLLFIFLDLNTIDKDIKKAVLKY